MRVSAARLAAPTPASMTAPGALHRRCVSGPSCVQGHWGGCSYSGATHTAQPCWGGRAGHGLSPSPPRRGGCVRAAAQMRARRRRSAGAGRRQRQRGRATRRWRALAPEEWASSRAVVAPPHPGAEQTQIEASRGPGWPRGSRWRRKPWPDRTRLVRASPSRDRAGKRAPDPAHRGTVEEIHAATGARSTSRPDAAAAVSGIWDHAFTASTTASSG